MTFGFNLCIALLQLKDLRVGQRIEPCIGLTQENSIENSLQDCLPFYTKGIWSMLCVIRRECGQTLGRVRVRTVVIISLQWTKG